MATPLLNNADAECSICFEIYKTPKILSCGHSFCLKCLVRYIDGRKGSFPCPVCKQVVQIPRGGVNKFVTNFSLQTMTDSVRATDISAAQKHYCPNHSKKEVEYYCQTCNLELCSKCIYRDHKDHKTLDLECDSTREMIVEKLSKSEQFIKNKIEDLEKTHVTLLETSEKLKSFCDKACTKIRDKTEKVISELRKNYKKRQQEIKRHFDKNDSKLSETRQKVVTQIQNIKTDLDTFCPTTTEELSLTLIYSLNKLQDLQKLCETMKTDIPPVTYIKWKEGSVKVCDMLGSTETKLLCQSREGYVFKFNYNDIMSDFVEHDKKQYSKSPGVVRGCVNYRNIKYDEYHYCKDKYESSGMIWSCRVLRNRYNRCLYIDIGLLPAESDDYCEIKYTLTLYNKDKDKNLISETRTEIVPSGLANWIGDIQIPWNKLTDPSEGFIHNDSQFLVRLDILHKF